MCVCERPAAPCSTARLLMPDGERVEVRTKAPMRWAPYVGAAVDFASWAFLSPAERLSAIRADDDRRTFIEAEISRTNRFTSIVAGRPLEVGTQGLGFRG